MKEGLAVPAQCLKNERPAQEAAAGGTSCETRRMLQPSLILGIENLRRSKDKAVFRKLDPSWRINCPFWYEAGDTGTKLAEQRKKAVGNR